MGSTEEKGSAKTVMKVLLQQCLKASLKLVATENEEERLLEVHLLFVFL